MENKFNSLLDPKTLDDIIGYHKLTKGDGILKKVYDNAFIVPLVLYGQPGIGKSTLIKILANKLLVHARKIVYINANFENKKSLVDIKESNETVVLVIDEIHLFNRTNQELISGLLDTKKVILLASTTMNPYIYLIPSLRSRVQVIELIQNQDEFLDDFYNKIEKIEFKNSYKKSDIKKLLEFNNFDLRNTLQIIDIIDNLYDIDEINDELLDKIAFKKSERVGLETTEFHDLKSCLQKSIRGSDVDASLYYLAALIKFADLKMIIRRLVIIAYEDIGLANPNLCLRVAQAANAIQEIGLPEAKIILSNIVIELSLSEKSNSAYEAISKASDYLDKHGVITIPDYLKQNHAYIKGAHYKYPFSFENNWVDQRYLPKDVNETFYVPNKYNSTEQKINKHYEEWIKKVKGNK